MMVTEDDLRRIVASALEHERTYTVSNGMSEEDIRRIVRQVIDEGRRDNIEADETQALKTFALLLKGFGLDEDEEKEYKEDFRYLRRWRLGTERITGMTLTAAVTLIVGGLLSALYLGLKVIGGKP